MPATLPDLTDTETWMDDDLDALRVAVLAEQERRHRAAQAPAQAPAQVADLVRSAVAAGADPDALVTAAQDAATT
ncbi:hypothetical protein [Micrococcus sp.]|uniref:hypothetical protein n=1 Tax=Micrococcus sp. TaxID=1271 RepID=UPI002A91AAC3|nr:hypothetical protein [Micrococcus sp.]MDY6054335.1 hypothetical protein [Micrococcus sp.]